MSLNDLDLIAVVDPRYQESLKFGTTSGKRGSYELEQVSLSYMTSTIYLILRMTLILFTFSLNKSNKTCTIVRARLL